jgi:hypothetical protein
MKNKIRAFFLAAILTITVSLCSCGAEGGSVVGVWKCELYSSEQKIEFTSDGRFIDLVTFSENRYRTEDSKIIIYVEDVPGSEISMSYRVKGSTLVLGETEYTKVEIENQVVEG